MAMPRPILIAGPTASGKSALALQLASAMDGIIINADALQVYSCWQVLTARPGPEDLEVASHSLYGHVDCKAQYSVGEWLKDVSRVIDNTSKTPIIIGGTGLYFTALTTGLADIPAIPDSIREDGNRLRAADGCAGFIAALERDDPETLATLDRNNPMRLQRAWEVLQATGRGLRAWQADTAAPLLPLTDCAAYVLNVETAVLNARIDTRFDNMIAAGAMDEISSVMGAGWDAAHPSARAIGAAELVAVLQGERALDDAIEAAKLATRQYAKRQRSWFRNRMPDWHQLPYTNEAERVSALAGILESAQRG